MCRALFSVVLIVVMLSFIILIVVAWTLYCKTFLAKIIVDFWESRTQ